jgi:hypothetical protein
LKCAVFAREAGLFSCQQELVNLGYGYFQMFSGKLVEDVTSAVNAFHIPPEIKKIATDFSTGETVLHKAARLGYVVKS